MSEKAYINNIATAIPNTEVHGIFLEDGMQFFDTEKKVKIFKKLAAKSHIDTRFSVLQNKTEKGEAGLFEFYKKGSFPTTEVRMKKYQEHALPLAAKAVAQLQEKGELEGITHVIAVSCTGFYAPGLDIELVENFNLPKNTERSIIGFMGCYAAFNAYKQARHIVRSDENAKILVVNLELCSLHFQESSNLEQMISFLIFADGCAATVISAEDRGIAMQRFDSFLLSEGADKITWDVGDQGFNMHLALDVPKVIGNNADFLSKELLDDPVDLWAIHPGGRSILDTVQEKFEIPEEKMNYSREVLRNCGNMSSATVPFVLEKILRDPQASGVGQAMAFGPGMTVESMGFYKRPM